MKQLWRKLIASSPSEIGNTTTRLPLQKEQSIHKKVIVLLYPQPPIFNQMSSARSLPPRTCDWNANWGFSIASHMDPKPSLHTQAQKRLQNPPSNYNCCTQARWEAIECHLFVGCFLVACVVTTIATFGRMSASQRPHL